MPDKPLKKPEGPQGVRQQLADDLHHDRELRAQSYREQALKLYPWICARCGREFSGKKLRELTVHHKDHNHDYNPADGSNWELLCLYCHEQEHTKLLQAESLSPPQAARPVRKPSTTFQPFAELEKILKRE